MAQELSAAAALLERCISVAADAIVRSAAELDDLDSRVGDGDCGSTLRLAAQEVKQVRAAPLLSFQNVALGQESRRIEMCWRPLNKNVEIPVCSTFLEAGAAARAADYATTRRQGGAKVVSGHHRSRADMCNLLRCFK